jgi:hypothetical protein
MTSQKVSKGRRIPNASTSAATVQAITRQMSARIEESSDVISSTKMCGTDSPKTSVSTINEDMNNIETKI